jgi:5-methylcytosine-specific restriction protein A
MWIAVVQALNLLGLSFHQNTQAAAVVKTPPTAIRSRAKYRPSHSKQPMPFRLKIPCRVPGCPNLSHGTYCDAHRGPYTRLIDARRGTPAQRGYDASWAALANLRRQRDCGLCQECLKTNRLTASRIVDHLVPIHVRPDWRLVLGNTQVLCSSHHQQKTRTDTQTYGSSTQKTPTIKQQQNRTLAQQPRKPPRDEE